MTFQQSLYAAFILSVALLSAATFIILLNDFTITIAAAWFIIGAVPFTAIGLPAFIIRHTGILGTREEEHQEHDTT